MFQLASALLAVGGGCGDAEGPARQHTEELEAISARLDKIEAEQARIVAQGLPVENEIAADAKHAADMQAVLSRFEQLEAEQKRMADDRAALEKELDAANDDEQRQKELEAKLAALDAQMEGDIESETKPKSTRRKNRVGLDEDDDPLRGI